MEDLDPRIDALVVQQLLAGVKKPTNDRFMLKVDPGTSVRWIDPAGIGHTETMTCGVIEVTSIVWPRLWAVLRALDSVPTDEYGMREHVLLSPPTDAPADRPTARLRIEGDGTQRGTRIWVGDQRLAGVQEVTIRMGLHQKPEAVIVVRRPDLALDGEFEVDERAT